MKTGIPPAYNVTQVTCTCGNTFTTRSTATSGSIHADVCSACHPFYTGKQKILDTGGRVARFDKRDAAQKAPTKTHERPNGREAGAESRPPRTFACSGGSQRSGGRRSFVSEAAALLRPEFAALEVALAD